MEWIITYKNQKSPADLKERDIIYIQKLVKGFSHDLVCKFISFKSGIVRAKVFDVKPDCEKQRYISLGEGEVVTARVDKCFLWGIKEGEINPRCHWFKNQSPTSQTLPNGNPNGERNTGLDVQKSKISSPKLPTATSPNPNIRRNKISHLKAGCKY